MAATDSMQPASRTQLVTAAELRAFTGYKSTVDGDDDTADSAIQQAMGIVINELAPLRHGVRLRGIRDGVNTRFQVSANDLLTVRAEALPGTFQRQRARMPGIILDADLNEASDAADVTVFLRTADLTGGPDTYTTATVDSVDGVHGIITLDSAPAGTVDAVEATGRFVRRPYNTEDVKTAILLMAAVLFDKAVRKPGKTNLANPNTHKKDSAPPQRPQSWDKMYAKHVRAMKAVIGQAASVRTSLGGGRRWPELL